MTPARLARRGLRRLVAWWWQSVRPSSGAVLTTAGEARPAHETGRPPHPDERWTARAPTTGPWAEVDPLATGRWPRPATMATVGVWGAMVALRVRRDLRATNRRSETSDHVR